MLREYTGIFQDPLRPGLATPEQQRHGAPVGERMAATPPSASDSTAASTLSLADIDELVIAILAAPLAPGESFLNGYHRKEEAIGALFAELSVLEARALHARLSANASDDPLARQLMRLNQERRARLLAFLADARRREAQRLRDR